MQVEAPIIPSIHSSCSFLIVSFLLSLSLSTYYYTPYLIVCQAFYLKKLASAEKFNTNLLTKYQIIWYNRCRLISRFPARKENDISLYNLMFGQNPQGAVILKTLGLTEGDVGRYRDCFIFEGKIAVYTRNGGGNRDHWSTLCDTDEGIDCECPGCIITYRLPQHPYYLYDKDDNFDRTYATVYFSFPPEFQEDLERLDSGEKFEPSERWLDMLEKIRTVPKGE